VFYVSLGRGQCRSLVEVAEKAFGNRDVSCLTELISLLGLGRMDVMALRQDLRSGINCNHIG
jgi:hypothetical protein